ncbi:cbb3-type cytochrome oxidase assembly protein CcoS [Aquabacterium sp. J223]|uniref:cbb3-type cytochrome oxidase assembly protein CcoS n=1 Tax=Aquabacterium sp. J223 TaxID=2898431 RepID=UPI0021AD5A36|nr:cbb3-type cytochrome oxidase assembly protein CcoS [Aquabacterium sp. J223]UUX95031.1 cbb3-type cytochrome oxidase assembly protein CcoS [Aquabacterium sp. J223]
MDILFLLVPMSVVLALLVLALFAWALNGGQFDDVEQEGERILLDGGQAPCSAGLNARQGAPAAALPEWPGNTRGTP